MIFLWCSIQIIQTFKMSEELSDLESIEEHRIELGIKRKEIKKLIEGEKLYYADLITKINHYGMNQERSIMLTNKALYNMKKKTLKRKIPYEEILGVTYSKTSYEFIIHGNNEEYDYSYISQDKNIIICIIAKFYEMNNGKPLKICEVQDKTLNNYITSKKDKEIMEI